MSGMKDLFGDTPYGYPHTAGYKERSTSREAARSIDATHLREKCLKAIRHAGAPGLTADEVADRVRMSVLAIRPRISELNTLKQIEEIPGARRKNASGRSAKVWRVK